MSLRGQGISAGRGLRYGVQGVRCSLPWWVSSLDLFVSRATGQVGAEGEDPEALGRGACSPPSLGLSVKRVQSQRVSEGSLEVWGCRAGDAAHLFDVRLVKEAGREEERVTLLEDC